MQTVVLASHLMVVLENSTGLVRRTSAQLTSIVPGRSLTHQATGDQSPPGYRP